MKIALQLLAENIVKMKETNEILVYFINKIRTYMREQKSSIKP